MDAAETDAANRWKSYLQGWKDGASGISMKEKFTTHENDAIRAEYGGGYSDGWEARRVASQAASERLCHYPSVLRTQEEKGDER
jgi:hypothetical protein